VGAGAPGRAAAPWLLDVGANIGTVCIPLVRDRAFAHALAFEPEPRNYRYLVRNVRANGLEAAVTTVNAGVSSVNTTMAMELAFDNYGDHRIRVAPPTSSHPECREEERAVIQVPVHRLDDFLPTVPVAVADVGLLWVDVQGHEHHVLEGAGALLTAGVPVVAEFWPYALARAGTDAAAFVALLRTRFRWFYDLESSAPARCPVADADMLLSRYGADTAFTDLLLLPG
jgi:FkbM family methyltransferase